MFSFGCVSIFPNRWPATNIDLFCGLLLYFSLNSSTPPRTTPRPWHTSSTTASSQTASGRTQNIRAMDSYLPSPLALRCSKARNSPSTTDLIWSEHPSGIWTVGICTAELSIEEEQIQHCGLHMP